jgi:hypothetical protein
MTFKRRITLVLAVLAVLPAIAKAQTTITNNVTAAAEGGRGGRGGDGGRGGTVVGGGGVYPSTIRNTPSSAIAMAAAYCQNAAGVGGSGPGFSFQALFGGHDVDCKRLNFAIFLTNVGRGDEALALLMNNREVADAFRTADYWRQARVAQVQPTAVAAAPPDPLPSRRDCIALRTLSRRWTPAQRLQYNRGCASMEVVQRGSPRQTRY